MRPHPRFRCNKALAVAAHLSTIKRHDPRRYLRRIAGQSRFCRRTLYFKSRIHLFRKHSVHFGAGRPASASELAEAQPDHLLRLKPGLPDFERQSQRKRKFSGHPHTSVTHSFRLGTTPATLVSSRPHSRPNSRRRIAGTRQRFHSAPPFGTASARRNRPAAARKLQYRHSR